MLSVVLIILLFFPRQYCFAEPVKTHYKVFKLF